MMTEELMIKIDNVSKQYKLGQIGGTTLKEELQRKRARMLGKEDPTKKIGAKDYTYGETFMALDGVSFNVKKGERVGIIGHNGAGKSTLLKLISRITAPTEGFIGLNGRITSMLEVGTGFHGELTGRENIYMNGAILGMTKKEIDSKIDEIIEFSECSQFIDTPVKRYSSGMYVKLAFSVAAHLDSEIMIMDEVLAVGDVTFQNKCLNKMNEVSRNQGRTILYVSHNMNTIRRLCDRCIVLNHGRLVYDGQVENAISLYVNMPEEIKLQYDLDQVERPYNHMGKSVRVNSFKYLDDKNNFRHNETIRAEIEIAFLEAFHNMRIRLQVYYMDGSIIGLFESPSFDVYKPSIISKSISINPYMLPIGKYFMRVDVYSVDEICRHETKDHPIENIIFEISEDNTNAIRWEHSYMGHARLGTVRFSKMQNE